MKITIDTDNKVVKVLETINLAILVKALKQLLKDDYDKYVLESGSIVYSTWTNPIIMPYSTPTPSPYPYTYPTICSSSGSYNIELKDITTY